MRRLQYSSHGFCQQHQQRQTIQASHDHLDTPDNYVPCGASRIYSRKVRKALFMQREEVASASSKR